MDGVPVVGGAAMVDVELLVPLAEIAGVFVGFGALIAVRSGGPTEPLELAPMRSMVSLGMLTIVAALAPRTLGGFDLDEHQIWALSSALVIVGWVVFVAVNARTPEWRVGWAAAIEDARTRSSPSWVAVIYWPFYVLFLAVVLAAPWVILLGVAPELEAALYQAEVVLILLGAGWLLLELVFAQRRPVAS